MTLGCVLGWQVSYRFCSAERHFPELASGHVRPACFTIFATCVRSFQRNRVTLTGHVFANWTRYSGSSKTELLKKLTSKLCCWYKIRWLTQNEKQWAVPQSLCSLHGDMRRLLRCTLLLLQICWSMVMTLTEILMRFLFNQSMSGSQKHFNTCQNVKKFRGSPLKCGF